MDLCIEEIKTLQAQVKTLTAETKDLQEANSDLVDHINESKRHMAEEYNLLVDQQGKKKSHLFRTIQQQHREMIIAVVDKAKVIKELAEKEATFNTVTGAMQHSLGKMEEEKHSLKKYYSKKVSVLEQQLDHMRDNFNKNVESVVGRALNPPPMQLSKDLSVKLLSDANRDLSVKVSVIEEENEKLKDEICMAKEVN